MQVEYPPLGGYEIPRAERIGIVLVAPISNFITFEL
ncbi:MAG: hypothetical protein BWX96_01996 [Bacteroidetes bacterium ADurb.Bin145]|jgi:hypothetical protein|nr:MAG: hypothetical protein BWX96_01996 [Bacteroidetes bacterium ADurb.Bin145]